MRAKFIYEKFEEESDPITDMGIGAVNRKEFDNINDFLDNMIGLLPYILKVKNKNEIIKTINNMEWKDTMIPSDLYNIFCDWSKHKGKVKIGDTYVYDVLQEGWCHVDKKVRIIHIKDDVTTAYWTVYVLYKLYKLGVNMNYGQRKRHGIFIWDHPEFVRHTDKLHEKFSKESDPIHDMNIGLPSIKNFDSINEFMEHIILLLPHILHVKDAEAVKEKISKMIWRDTMIPSKLFDTLVLWFRSNIPFYINGNKVTSTWDLSNITINNYNMGWVGYIEQYLNNIGIFREGDNFRKSDNLHEKFQEKSDPIKDMDIGIGHLMWDIMKDYTMDEFLWHLENSFPEFDKYKENYNNYIAYIRIPLSELKNAGITEKLLNRISKNSGRKWIHDVYDNTASLGFVRSRRRI